MRTLLAIACLLLLTGAARAQPQDDLSAAVQAFDDGTALVTAGDFQGALERFQEAQSGRFESVALWYNMGVAHYRMDHLGLAILHFERARRLAPEDERVVHSLAIAQRHRTDSFSALPAPFWKRGHTWLLGFFPLWLWFTLGATLLWLAAGLAIGEALTDRRIPESGRIRRWALTLAVPILLFALWSSMDPPVRPAGIVIIPETTLTEQPDESAVVVERLHEGTFVTLLTETDEWLLVRLSNGAEGWLPARGIGRI